MKIKWNKYYRNENMKIENINEIVNEEWNEIEILIISRK